MSDSQLQGHRKYQELHNKLVFPTWILGEREIKAFGHDVLVNITQPQWYHRTTHRTRARKVWALFENVRLHFFSVAVLSCSWCHVEIYRAQRHEVCWTWEPQTSRWNVANWSWAHENTSLLIGSGWDSFSRQTIDIWLNVAVRLSNRRPSADVEYTQIHQHSSHLQK